MSYGEGIALGIHLVNMERSASAGVADAEYEAGKAKRRMRDAESALKRAEEEIEELSFELAKTSKDSVYYSKLASAGFIFMNSFMKALENMNPAEAASLKEEVKNLSTKRMLEIDTMRNQEALLKGTKNLEIIEAFSKTKEFETLGFKK